MAYDNDKPIYVWPADIKGPDGNAFVMVHHGAQQLKKFGASADFIRSFKEEAMSKDNDHLIRTIKNYFNVMVPTTTFELLEEDASEAEFPDPGW